MVRGPIALLLSLAPLCAASLSDLTPVRTLELKGDTGHVQGIDADPRRLWITSVDRATRKGHLFEYSLETGERLREVDVTIGERYHPGGMTADGDSLWIPVAEYKRASSSTIQKRSARTLAVEFQFEVNDHIGCLAVTRDAIIGANWDSRDFYIWDRAGRLLRKVANPTPNGYQDLKFVDGMLVGSGLLPGRVGAIDWLDYPSLRLVRRLDAGRTSRNVPFTNEGMTIRGNRLLLLPEDSNSRLFEFRLPAPSEAGYETREIEGWQALLAADLTRPDDAETAATLAELRAQLHAIARAVPAPALARLRDVPIWIHRKSPTRCMAFHPSADWLATHDFNPRMAGAIEIGNTATFLSWTRQQPWMVFHELAHAYHFRVLGFDHPDVRRTWEAARTAGRYQNVLHIGGATKPHYALTNHKEYFAELSESYFGTNDFFPFVKPELKQHDAAGHDLIRRLWGAP